jgi:predicted nucleic acid-binding protein
VRTFVIDASIAIKWVVEESGTPEAVRLLGRANLVAPDLLIPECANILLKKVQKDELTKEEVLLAARILQTAEIELVPMRTMLEPAVRIAVELNHPAYDCVYLALAIDRDCPFATADEQFVQRLSRSRSRYRERVIGLVDVPAEL